MIANNESIKDYGAILDEKYGKEGSPERNKFDEEAKAFYAAQILLRARKEAKITQSELAKRIGTTKSYISKIENGVIEPGIGLYFRLVEALGLNLDISKMY